MGRNEVHSDERSGRPSVSEAVIEMIQHGVLQNTSIVLPELVVQFSFYGIPIAVLTEKMKYHNCFIS